MAGSDPTPHRAREFLDLALDNGWAGSFVPRTDTGGSAYVEVRVIRDGQEVRASWSTRGTGTYRLSSCLVKGGVRGWYDATLSTAKGILARGVGA